MDIKVSLKIHDISQSSNSTQGKVYNIIWRFVSDLRQVWWFSPGTPVSSTNNTDCDWSDAKHHKTIQILYLILTLNMLFTYQIHLEIWVHNTLKCSPI